MNQKARQLLETLRQTTLFVSVGVPTRDRDVARARNWKEAMKRAKSKQTSNAWIDAGNVLSEELFRKDRERFNTTWNETAEEARALIKEIVVPRVTEITTAHGLDETFLNFVVGDFVCACHELEYEDVMPAQLYLKLADWFFAGHFPCGWEGRWPQGRLVVY